VAFDCFQEALEARLRLGHLALVLRQFHYVHFNVFHVFELHHLAPFN
jgi:hypothetical protein